jgi:hypothetical protein
MHSRLFTIPFLLCAFATSACSDDTETESGSISVQISGEAAAADGFAFPSGSEVTFNDGWELRFTHLLVTVANVTLSDNPDRSPSDQSETGPVVARAAGPWAVDLHAPGSLPAIGGEGTATPLLTFERTRDGQAFESDRRYAFGYDLTAASADATPVNFAGDADTEAAYRTMVENGYAVMYMGTASFRGEDCVTSDPDYDFSAVPTEVPFALGFATPTRYENCQNQENQGEPFEDEEALRGVQVLPNRAAVAQITLHVEHPFFSDLEHDPSVYFDQMAAQLVGADAGEVLTSDHFAGIDPTAFADGVGVPLPNRSCLEDSPLAAGKQRAFGTGTTPIDPSAEPARALRDYRDYVSYVQSTQGHLNGGEGLCFVERQYPSPR